LPHRRALEDERELEEERRLAYVGMTRAKDRLFVTHALHRSTYGVGAQSEASRFLAELPEELLAAERDAAPYRRGGQWPRGTDDAGGWLPGGYRSPTRRVGETLRPVNLPDMASGPVGAGLDAARERVARTGYPAGADPDLGAGGFVGAAPAAAPAQLAWQAGDRVRHRRYGEGRVVSSEIVKGDEEVTVDFDEHGRKHLIVAYAGLERA
jgi:DNA helicase-2/ATP-dependent DNA helicase PcrA